MGLTVLPTSIGGVSLSSAINPLASLLGFGSSSASNLVYPSDLGSNPSMGHAVIFTIYDYTSELGNNIKSLTNVVSAEAQNLINNDKLPSITDALDTAKAIGKTTPSLLSAITAGSYKPLIKSDPYATVSLFMPETVNTTYNSNYSEVSLTRELGILGLGANAYSDYNKNGLGAAAPAAKSFISSLAGKALGTLTRGDAGALGALFNQAQGIYINPQVQLLYRGIGLREFQLEFTMTPKTKAEAQSIKSICDTFVYYSLPGLAGASENNSGQYLTPPQIFKIDFRFLGNSGITSVISSAFNAIGLGAFTSGSPTTTSGSASPTLSVDECVLTNVSIDYAPNGWATYEDGNPIQTRLILQFKEMTIRTKQSMKGTKIADNYNDPTFMTTGVRLGENPNI